MREDRAGCSPRTGGAALRDSAGVGRGLRRLVRRQVATEALPIVVVLASLLADPPRRQAELLRQGRGALAQPQALDQAPVAFGPGGQPGREVDAELLT